MRQVIGVISSTIAALILAGCGGGSGGTTDPATGLKTATFIDLPVSGLEFDTKYEHNITDKNGNFRYTEGESITFHIGKLYLGSAKPTNGVITPLDIIGKPNSSDPQVVRILQTLQSLDSDGNTSNGIDINSTITEALKNQTVSRVDLNATSIKDSDVQALIGTFKVDAQTAIKHFELHKNDPSNRSKGYTAPATVPTTTTGSGGTASDMGNSGKYTLVAWNDLGMHCVDGKDYSIFSILPPYNNLHAHLISKDATKSIMSGVTLTYEAVADANGSINTTSNKDKNGGVKTNFWDYVGKLFSSAAAALGIDTGLTGNKTQSNTPQTMTYNSTKSWWEAEGIPAMPYDDNGAKNYYPMVKVVAKDSSNNVLATTRVVLSANIK